MPSNEPRRPGSTPIIRLDGNSVTYHLWITQPLGRCDLLVIRCDGHGNVLASIRGEPDECKPHSPA